MIFKRLGQIFDPTCYDLPLNCREYAQSPQILEFADFLRIYFSTRALDRAGKFLSHVAYVDVEKNLRDVIAVSKNEVIPLGRLGCFDEHGIFPFSVTQDGESIYAYTTGWSRRVAVSVETGIGLCISSDGGHTFQRIGEGPIMTSSLNEPFLVGDAFVRRFGDQFHMWYIHGLEWRRFTRHSAPERIYKINHALSSDGVNWRPRARDRQLIPDILGSYESQALPSVACYKDQYYMAFCYRESHDFRTTKGRGYRLGFARSDDLVTWERLDIDITSEIPPVGWDSDMQAYPHLFILNHRLMLLYNGNQFGRLGFGVAELCF